MNPSETSEAIEIKKESQQRQQAEKGLEEQLTDIQARESLFCMSPTLRLRIFRPKNDIFGFVSGQTSDRLQQMWTGNNGVEGRTEWHDVEIVTEE